MRLGILLSGTGLGIESWQGGMALAREMGYSQVELAANDVGGGGGKPDMGKCATEAAARGVVETARGMGLGVSAFQCHTGYLPGNAAGLPRIVDHAKRMIDLAAAADVPVVHTVSGPPAEGRDEADEWDMLATAYRQLLDHARSLDGKVVVGIEPVFVYRVGNLATTRKLFALVAGDLAINFDPSHFPYHDEDCVPFIHEFGDRIVHAHLKDAAVTPGVTGKPNSWPMPTGDREFAFAPPGRGVIDFAQVITALKDVGFDGVLSLELGHGVPEPEQAARDTVTFTRAVCEQCGVPLA